MIASIKGTVLSKKPESVVVDVHGIGYRVFIPLSCLGDIPEPGNALFLHTYTHVREDALQLYGFISEEERNVFTTLIGISGIGPRLGLAILSGMPVVKFVETVENEDVSLLTTIPGLGRKTASRLVLELRGKLPSPVSAEAVVSQADSAAEDAISALVNLGYKKPSAEKAVETALKGGAGGIEDVIREALKYLTEK